MLKCLSQLSLSEAVEISCFIQTCIPCTFLSVHDTILARRIKYFNAENKKKYFIKKIL